MYRCVSFTAALALVCITGSLRSESVLAQTINGTGPYHGPAGFQRGMQAVEHCPYGNPESWVRASASLNKADKKVTVSMQLESDSITAGPKGKAEIFLKDASGKTIAVLNTKEVGRGGRHTRHADDDIVRPEGSIVVKPDVAQKTISLEVHPSCTGTVPGLHLGGGGGLTHCL